MKRILTVITLLLGISVLCGCAAGFDAAGLLQGNLDLIYLNKYTDQYLDSVELTAGEADQQYEDGINAEMEYFADYYGVDLSLCSEELKEEIREVYRRIYDHSKYEVGSAVNNDGTYVVSLTVWPIDIMKQVDELDSAAFMEKWNTRYNAGEFDAMTAEQYEEEWVRGILNLIRPRLEDIGYEDPETVAVQIAKDEADGLYVIAENDFIRIDSLIIAY